VIYFVKKDVRKMNLYMRDEESFNLLKERLKNFKLKIIQGDIFNIKSLNNKYDLIFLSNVLQYLNISCSEKIQDKVYEIFSSLNSYLNDNGNIQLFYLYGSLYPKEFISILKKFEEYNILLEKLKCMDSDDSIILVKKH